MEDGILDMYLLSANQLNIYCYEIICLAQPTVVAYEVCFFDMHTYFHLDQWR